MKRTLLTLLLLLSTLAGSAQSRIVTGRIVDAASKQALVGAAVVVAGSSRGATSSTDGRFQIEIPAGGKALQVSLLGYDPAMVALNSRQTHYEIALTESAEQIDNIVVVGYGAVKKSDLTGSVAQLKSSELMKNNPVSLETGLQGRLTGVNVVTNDGAPGSGISVQIRGANSFLGGTEPLWVIDGVPVTSSNDQETIDFEDGVYTGRNALSFLDPADIASIEVLKDASSTAIYGSRGANGVVLVTTKSGKEAMRPDVITFSYNLTVSQVAKKIRMLGAQEYAMYRNESAINTAIYNGNTFSQGDLPFPGTNIEQGGYKKGPNEFGNDPYYWQNQIFQTALSHNANLNVSGQRQGMDYSFSGGYLDQQGTVLNSDYKRYNFKINFNKQVNRWLKIGTSTGFSSARSNMLKTTLRNAGNGTEGVIRSALMYPATYTVDDEVSRENEFGTVTTPSLYAKALNEHRNLTVRTSNYANIQLWKHLIFRTVLGYSNTSSRANQYWPVLLYEGRDVNGRSYAGDNSWNSLVFDNLLMYNQDFQKHHVSATLGTSWEESHFYNKSISVFTFGTDLTNGWLLQDAANTNTPQVRKGDSQLFSVIMRAAYNYDHKYYLTFTARHDSSSKFAKGHRSAFFPSAGISYRMTQERFMEPLKKVITNLKLRYSYGLSGNQAISSYQTFALMTGANYPFGKNVVNGYAPDPRNPGNANLTWETTYQHDAGVELSLFDRIDLTVDYYHKTTEDLLQYKEQATSTGVQRILSNAGSVINRGVEFSVKGRLVDTKEIRLSAGANFSFNHNELADFGDKPMFPNELWNSLRPFALQDGHAIGSLYGFVEDGIWSSREEVIGSPQFQLQYPGYTTESNDPATEIIIKKKWIGEIRYLNLDDDPAINDNDRTYIGNTQPKYFYGFNLDFQWKNLDFSALFQGVHGNDILNMNLLRFYDVGNSKNIPLRIYKESWTPEHGGTAPKNFYDNGRTVRFSRRYVEDGSYLKLRNLQIGYTLRKPFKGITSIRLSFTGTNLFTWTDYTGYDPEVNSFGSDPSMRGIDSGGYPQSRSYIFGINVTF